MRTHTTHTHSRRPVPSRDKIASWALGQQQQQQQQQVSGDVPLEALPEEDSDSPRSSSALLPPCPPTALVHGNAEATRELAEATGLGWPLDVGPGQTKAGQTKAGEDRALDEEPGDELEGLYWLTAVVHVCFMGLPHY